HAAQREQDRFPQGIISFYPPLYKKGEAKSATALASSWFCRHMRLGSAIRFTPPEALKTTTPETKKPELPYSPTVLSGKKIAISSKTSKSPLAPLFQRGE
ncbi:MAG: hypothetical protein Q8O06_07245, partial [Acetobacterium sp.]|nr:hypothetical protein [Acetobacterium sp.]